MLFLNSHVLAFSLLVGVILSTYGTRVSGADPYLWLEEIESPESLSWVNSHNERTLPVLTQYWRYPEIERDIRKVLLSQDRIPTPTLHGKWIYTFWQDSEHIRGLWRRVLFSGFQDADPKWENVIDLDALAKTENENWVWKSFDCLPPQYERCLIHLSRGGKDARVVREYDLPTRSFVEAGFVLPEAKSNVDWFDPDTLLVATDEGEGSLTHSGYPRRLRLWKRGTALSQAKLIFEGASSDLSVYGSNSIRPEGTFAFIGKATSFYSRELYHLNENGNVSKLDVPLDSVDWAIFRNYMVLSLRSDWQRASKIYSAGSVIAVDLSKRKNPPKILFEPNERSTFVSLTDTNESLYLNILDNVKGRLLSASVSDGIWRFSKIPIPENGSLQLLGTDRFSSRQFVNYESFLEPPSLYLVNSDQVQLVKQRLSQFNANGLMVEQLESVSKDGTKIPYFVVRNSNSIADGNSPTLLYGYGGFERAQTPLYLNDTGKIWSEKGGVYVVANIRGGGEFGPKWHQAALTVNRQRAFDDFIGVAEDLIKKRITSADRLGIRGGSNGGLLVGASFTQRPDLFKAVICLVPLLDMMRYHKLLAGHSWIAEFGNPDEPTMGEVIKKYSPYHNLSSGTRYPKVFFLTSTKDDRVHPGHARKMVARMEELGQEVLYYENTEGGHGSAANIEQQIRRRALEYTYLYQSLVDH